MADRAQEQNPGTNRATFEKNWKVTPLGIAAVALVLWLAFLITWILMKGSEIGTPALPQSALIAANERLLQMVQWTIATILTLGGALIGLNWYQGEKRYEHDRRVFEQTVTEEVEKRFGEYKTNLDLLTRASILSLDTLAAQRVEESVGPKDGTVNDLTFVDRVISTFETNDATLARRGAAHLLVRELVSAANTIPGKPGRLEQEQLDRIEEIVQLLARDALDKANELEFILNGYKAWEQMQPNDNPTNDGSST